MQHLPNDFFQRIARPIARLVKRKMDYNHPIVVQYARQLAAQYPGEFNIAQICRIYDHLKRNWRYVEDPVGTEYIAFASESIQNGFVGDCDDFAVTMASLIAAIGGTTRVIFAWSPLGGHAYAEVFVAHNDAQLEEIINNINQHYRTIAEAYFDKELVAMFSEEEENEDFESLELPWDDYGEIIKFLKQESPISISVHRDRDPQKLWLNLDWSSKYPGGPIYRASQGIIIHLDRPPIITSFSHEIIE